MNQARNLKRTSLAKEKKNIKTNKQPQQQAKTKRKEQHIIIEGNNSSDDKYKNISRHLGLR